MKILRGGILLLGTTLFCYYFYEYVGPSIMVIPSLGILWIMYKYKVSSLAETNSNQNQEELEPTEYSRHTGKYLREHNTISETTSVTMSATTDSFFDSSDSDSSDEASVNSSKESESLVKSKFQNYNTDQVPYVSVTIP
ncbi:hypothetical protein K7432_002783 [Basidiobolus ranarum]|uniref:Uncharacterized protein n=1 Tax=Basidiobolus ranarum TaxID=34480 RepID=A0ABR2W7T3_9FUNG